jgi:hypothetical protein
MISVIMPTMWKPEGVLQRIKEIVSRPSVSELILIDNTLDGIDLGEDIPKVIHIKEGRNTFVNPAWNKGVDLAKEDRLLIVNDDVDSDWSVIDFVVEHITPDKGIIGAGKSCWQFVGGDPGIVHAPHRVSCYGCVMFIHKKSYVAIPDEIKVHYGDDWLFIKSGKPNFELINWEMRGESEQTSGLKEFDKIKELDKEIFLKYLNN